MYRAGRKEIDRFLGICSRNAIHVLQVKECYEAIPVFCPGFSRIWKPRQCLALGISYNMAVFILYCKSLKSVCSNRCIPLSGRKILSFKFLFGAGIFVRNPENLDVNHPFNSCTVRYIVCRAVDYRKRHIPRCSSGSWIIAIP